jgi:hypothetical protein
MHLSSWCAFCNQKPVTKKHRYCSLRCRDLARIPPPKLTPSDEQVAWAAGIYEGEGHINPDGATVVTQKDRWLLYRLQILFGGRIHSHGDVYQWHLGKTRGISFLQTIRPWLSPRRLQQINKVITCI